MRLLQKVMIGLGLLAGAAALSCLSAPALADSSSPNYDFQETQLGGAGFTGSSSLNYQTAGTTGLLGVGTSIGSQYQIQAGHQTTGDPALTFIVNTSSAAFGNFSPGSTTTSTATFAVINYTSYGYIVQVFGSAPTNGAHSITSLSSTASPNTGVEQFGINLVANTLPTSFGSNPAQIPDSSFGNGTVHSSSCASITPGYDTVNQFKYVSGDTIAAACKTSGETDYTISYIVDVSDVTPAGQYTSGQTLLCTATY